MTLYAMRRSGSEAQDFFFNIDIYIDIENQHIDTSSIPIAASFLPSKV